MSVLPPRAEGRGRVHVLDLSATVPTRIRCPAGSRIVAVAGGVSLSYLEFEGAWLSVPPPQRRLRLDEGDSHCLPLAGEVTLYAAGGGRCLIVRSLPWWSRLWPWGRGVARMSEPVQARAPALAQVPAAVAAAYLPCPQPSGWGRVLPRR